MLALLLLCAALLQASGAAGAGPAVARCCPPGRELSPDALREPELEREAALVACREAVDTGTVWAPRVYAPARGTYLDRGRVPNHWREAAPGPPDCPRLRVLPEHAAPYALLANNGSLVARGPPPVAVAPHRYCADAAAALVCAEETSTAGASKCCAEGAAWDGNRCVANAAGSVASAALRALLNGSAAGLGWPACSAGPQYAVAGRLAGAQLATSGALQLGEARLAAGSWCAEASAESGAVLVLACADAARALDAAPVRHALYGAGLALGALFLAATLVAGFALPAAHHALHWRCQTHYVAALMVGDALLAATQLAGDAVPPPLCRALAVCMHFLFLSAFFWLNTMCFNIWWTFRDFRPTSLERGQEAWRLRVYMVYAWGGPLLLSGAAALLDALPHAGLLRPRFGERRCWFYGDLEILVYFFGPVGVLLLVNLALFVSTTRQLTCGLWRRDEVKSTSERAALGRVCAKLVVVMGVTWGADVVSWAVGGPHYVWYATDLLNALQGLLIFLVVGCQPHAWAALRGLARRACCGGARASSRPQRHTHSSTQLPSCGESLTHTTQAPPASAAPPAAPKIPMETVC